MSEPSKNYPDIPEKQVKSNVSQLFFIHLKQKSLIQDLKQEGFYPYSNENRFS